MVSPEVSSALWEAASNPLEADYVSIEDRLVAAASQVHKTPIALAVYGFIEQVRSLIGGQDEALATRLLEPIDKLFAAPLLPGDQSVNGFFSDVSSAAGMGEGQIRFLVCLLVGYLLGFVTARFPAGTFRHLLNVVFGVLTMHLVFGWKWVYVLASALSSYVLLVLLSPSSGSGSGKSGGSSLLPWHWFPVGVSLFFLVFRHLMREAGSRDSIDDCAAQMILVVKVHAMAWNLRDGTTERAQLKQRREEGAAARDALRRAGESMDPKQAKELHRKERRGKVAGERLDRCISAAPSLLQVLGYTLNPQTSLAGPSIEITQYLRAAESVRYRDGIPVTADDPASKMGQQLWRVLVVFFGGLLCMGLYQAVQIYNPISQVYDDEIQLGRGQPLWFNLPVFAVAWIGDRFLYYGVWLLAEGACVSAAYGYIDDHPADSLIPQFSAANNADPIGVETGYSYSPSRQAFVLNPSLRTLLRSWNKLVQSWLLRYTYLRLPGGINFAATFITSAVWHGFFPGYYIGFVTMALFQVAEDTLSSALLRLRITRAFSSGPLYPIGILTRTLFVQVLALYAMGPFPVLELTKGVIFLTRLRFVGIWIFLVIMVFGTIINLIVPKPKEKPVSFAPDPDGERTPAIPEMPDGKETPRVPG